MAKDLAARAQAAVANQASEQEAQPANVSPLDAMERLIYQRADKFAEAMGIDPDQLIRDAITAVRVTPKLRLCSSESVLGGLMTAAQLRLRVNLLGHCWLAPFFNRDKDCWEASFLLGYHGLIELGDRAGYQLNARAVHEGDAFSLCYSSEDDQQHLTHSPKLKGERGDPYGYYALARSAHRRAEFHYMTMPEIVAWKQRYTSEGPAWRNSFDAMACKTVLKQVARYLPKAAGIDLGTALAVDAGVRYDANPDVPADAVTAHPDDGGGQDIDDADNGHEAPVTVTGHPDEPDGEPDEPPADADTDSGQPEAGSVAPQRQAGRTTRSRTTKRTKQG